MCGCCSTRLCRNRRAWGSDLREGELVSLGWEEGSPTPEAGRPREGWCCYRQGGSWQGGAAEGQALPQLGSPFFG